MAVIKGAKEYKKFKEGKPLTRKEAMLAMCYVCNGESESNVDCQGYSCSLYQYHPYRGTNPSQKCAETPQKP